MEMSASRGLPNNPPTPQAGAVGWGEPGVPPKPVVQPPPAPETLMRDPKHPPLSPQSGGEPGGGTSASPPAHPRAPPALMDPEGTLAWDGTLSNIFTSF